jgi:uncharacterized protein (DUF952 family)
MLIYKIFRAHEWAQLQNEGHTKGATIDLQDGYIHLSSHDTVVETAARHFQGEGDLMLIAIEADGKDDLKWEASRGGLLFPHLYREMQMSDVVWAKPLPLTDGHHQFPALA